MILSEKPTFTYLLSIQFASFATWRKARHSVFRNTQYQIQNVGKTMFSFLLILIDIAISRDLFCIMTFIVICVITLSKIIEI